MGISWKKWFKCAGVRAGKTAAQVAIMAIGYQVGESVVEGGFNVFAMDWIFVIGFMLGGAVLSMLMSLKGLPEADPTEFATEVDDG